jgi:type II restriction enzyme
MRLDLAPPTAQYNSASQIARVTTELWVNQNFYCPSCGLSLASYPPGERVYDFYSPNCRENFQLKSASHRIGSSILGSAYQPTLNSILSNRQPSLLLLHYDRPEWVVKDFSIIHRACITESCIVPRNPLSRTARRAGWQGCIISLDRIPKLGKVNVVERGIVREKSQVLAQWRQSNLLLKKGPDVRGWLADILTCVEKLLTTFTLDDMYAFEEELSQKHPDNHNIRPKIRQQLQALRKLGLVKFMSPGVYQYQATSSANP